MRLRSRGASVSCCHPFERDVTTLTLWTRAADFIVALTFPRLLDAFTPTGAFLWYCGCTLLSRAPSRTAALTQLSQGAPLERSSSSSSFRRLATLRSKSSTKSSRSRPCATPSTSSEVPCESLIALSRRAFPLTHALIGMDSGATFSARTSPRVRLSTLGTTRCRLALDHTARPRETTSPLLNGLSLVVLLPFLSLRDDPCNCSNFSSGQTQARYKQAGEARRKSNARKSIVCACEELGRCPRRMNRFRS